VIASGRFIRLGAPIPLGNGQSNVERPIADHVTHQVDQGMGDGIGEKISVCLLTYNHVNVIGSTLESILNQTINGYEVVVSDDRSTDGTWETILEFGRKNSKIRPIRTPANIGMARNANFAVEHSSRPYIALLHHDDLYREDLLERWADIMERYAGAGFVYNSYDCPNSVVHHGPRLRQECVNGRWFLENRLFARWGCPVRGTAMIRRACWDRVGGMREQFDLVADVDLWMRLSNISEVGYVSESLITVRHLRPSNYPDIYTFKTWQWRRNILLYEIHAANRLAIWDVRTLRGKTKWWLFRASLSYQTVRSLVYGIVKRRRDVLETSSQSETKYDLWPLRVFRQMVQFAARHFA
jgi:glycosyltransferase involved in cell wall biosynthesis